MIDADGNVWVFIVRGATSRVPWRGWNGNEERIYATAAAAKGQCTGANQNAATLRREMEAAKASGKELPLYVRGYAQDHVKRGGVIAEDFVVVPLLAVDVRAGSSLVSALAGRCECGRAVNDELVRLLVKQDDPSAFAAALQAQT